MKQSSSLPIPVKTLMTHMHPDLDAIFSIYLIRRHGEKLFPGVENADLQFVSADVLPNGMTAEGYEKEGVLLLDTGGGRFDTHPVAGLSNKEKWDTCASKLVADTLGVADLPRYRFLLPFTLSQDASGKSLTSKDPAHHLLTPHSVLEGMHSFFAGDEKVVLRFLEVLESLAEASDGPEPDREQLAALFDRTLAAFLKDDYTPLTDFERKTPEERFAEGESHRVAIDNGWQNRRELEKLLRTSSRLLAGRDDALPVEEKERRVLVPMVLPSLAERFGEDSDSFRETAFAVFHGAIQREADWFSALQEVKRSARVLRGRHCNVVAIASRNGLVIKAARYSRGAQGVLYYDPGKGLVTVQAGYKPDGRPYLNLERLAARLRSAERVKRDQRSPLKNARAVGQLDGWFLHPSLQLLNRGSPKAPNVVPTALSYQELMEIVRSELQPEEKLPDWICPPEKCTEAKCLFFPLKLVNCRVHRERTGEQPRKGTLGELFADQLKKAKGKQG